MEHKTAFDWGKTTEERNKNVEQYSMNKITEFSNKMDTYRKNPLTLSMEEIKSIGFHQIRQLGNKDYILFYHGDSVAQDDDKIKLVKLAMDRTGVKYV